MLHNETIGEVLSSAILSRGNRFADFSEAKKTVILEKEKAFFTNSLPLLLLLTF